MSDTRKQKSVIIPTNNLNPEKPEQITITNLTTTKENELMQKEEIINLPLSKLSPFENHPFKVTQDDDFQKLIDSIKENGILIPAVARPKGDSYELISGHRREFACRMLGIDTMPVLVRELSDDQAVIAMTDSNVQRENILPSEKAFAYKMKMDAVKRQAGRPKNNSSQVGTKYRADVLVAQNTGDSRNQVQRYIRLTELIPQLLNMVDEKKIAFNPAVELSYLPKEQQVTLLSAMEAEQSTPSLSQAQKFKSMSADGSLTEDSMMELMREQKSNQKELVKIPYDKVKSIIKRDLSPKELEEFIIKAVADYQKKLNSRNKDAR